MRKPQHSICTIHTSYSFDDASSGELQIDSGGGAERPPNAFSAVRPPREETQPQSPSCHFLSPAHPQGEAKDESNKASQRFSALPCIDICTVVVCRSPAENTPTALKPLLISGTAPQSPEEEALLGGGQPMGAAEAFDEGYQDH